MRKSIFKKIVFAGMTAYAGLIFVSVAHAAAPFIYNVEVKNTPGPGFELSWTTDVPSDSTVYYDTWNINSFEYVSSDPCDAGGNVISHCVKVTGLAGNTTYYFEVASCAGGSCGVQFIFAETGNGPPRDTPPNAPSRLALSINGTSASLKWTDNSDNESGFEIYRNDGGLWNDIGSVKENVTEFVDSNLPKGTYKYRISSFITLPGLTPVYSTSSNKISVTIEEAPPVPATPPSPVQPVSGTPTSAGVCLLRNHYTPMPQFSAPDSKTGYAKQAKPGVNDIAGLRVVCTDEDFNALLKIYCVSNYSPVEEQVVTYDSSGNVLRVECRTDVCAEVQCPQKQVVTPDATPPSSPALSASALSASEVKLTWSGATDNVGVTGYRIYRDGTALKNDVTALSYTDGPFTPGSKHSYFVKAYDATGNYSLESNHVVVTTLVQTKNTAVNLLPKISNVHTSDVTSGDTKVNWDTELPSESQVMWGTKPNDYPNSAKWRCDGEGFVVAHCVNLTSLTPQTTYYLRVISRSSDGYVEYSSEFSFKTSGPTTQASRDTVSFIADTTPPKVTSFYVAPLNNGTQSMFTVKFSESIRPETLTPESVFVYPVNYPTYRVPGTFTIRPQGFDFITQNLPDADHVLVIKNNVKNFAGNSLVEDYVSVPVREHSSGQPTYDYPPVTSQVPLYVTGWVLNVNPKSGKSTMGVRFNTAIDRSTVNTKKVFIRKADNSTGPQPQVPASYSTSKESVSLVPSAPFAIGANYAGVVSADIKSAGGVALGSDFICPFTAIAEGYYLSCPSGHETPPTPIPEVEVSRTATFSGAVADVEGKPIPGATLSVSGESNISVLTRADGSFHVLLPPGRYIAEAFSPLNRDQALLRPAPVEFSIKENEQKTATFTFGVAVTAPKHIVGTVSFADGEVISGAQVIANNVLSHEWVTTFTNDKGVYEVKVVGGDWSLRVAPHDVSGAENFEGESRMVSFKNDSSVEKITVDFRVPPEDAKLTVHVSDDEQKPLQAGVTLDSVGANGVSSTGTAQTSRFAISDVAGNASFKVQPGTYFIRATLSSERGFVNPFEKKVLLRSGAESETLLIFKKQSIAATALLLGKVVRSDNNRTVPNAFVWGWSERGESLTTHTNDRGEFSIRARAGTRWHIGSSFLVNGFQYESGETIVASGGNAKFITLTLVKIKETPLAPPVLVEEPANVTAVAKTKDGVKVVAPPTSSNASDTISVSIVPAIDTPSAPGLRVLGLAYDITFRDSEGRAITEFPNGVEISLPYSDDDLKRSGVSLENIKPSYFDKSGVWVKIAGYVVDTVHHIIIVRVDHLTRFALVAAADFTPPRATPEVRSKLVGGGVALTWKNPESDFHHVKVYRSESKGELGLLLDDFVLANASLYVDEDAKPGVTYYYSIVEVDEAGNESPSTVSQAVTVGGHVLRAEPVAPEIRGEPIAPASPTVPRLYRGMRGQSVKILQQKLEDLGFFPAEIGPTGYFGPITQGSVRAFQVSKGLPPSGIVGAYTTAELGINFK